MANFEEGQQALHWLSAEDRWELISWDAWSAFRAITPFASLPDVVGGIHYFIVCIHDDGVPINLIPHKYIIEPDGRIGSDNFAGLTRTERDDYSRILLVREYGPGDEERLNEIRGKMGTVNYPPPGSFYPLVRALPRIPQQGSLAARFLEELRRS
jgi:hypothetical protein